MFIDNDFPKLLGAELYRPHPAYVVEMACEPVVVHDFTKQPGQTVQLDRYRFFGNPGTKTSRERTQDQTIGTANSRSIVKDKVLVSLREYTGPADPNNTNLPSTFKIARETLMTAQRLLLDTGNLNMFHQSIGSLTLLDDYRRWRDRVFLDELFKAESRGQSGDTQGGYYYPNDHTKTGVTVGAYTATEYASERFKFNVKTDLLNVVKSLRKRNVPVFQDGYYRCIADPSFMKDLRADQGFREVARYPGMGAPNPLMGMTAPNAALYQGGQYGQAQFVAGEPVMPSGFVFEGVRFFESTNFPSKTATVDIGDGSGAVAGRTTPAGLFFGPQAVGVGIGGPNAQVLINNNDDFSRFIILIWQLYAGFANLNKDFVTTAFTITE
jgi:hypothetical protein